MNLDNIKRAARIDKKIVYKKLKNKLLNQLVDKLYKLRDSKLSTYSYDYISFFRIDYSHKLDITELFEIENLSNEIDSFSQQCLDHNHQVLSNKLVNINTTIDYRLLQKNFNPKMIPFSTQCFNRISNGYKIIDWQKDYNSNFRWDYKWYKEIRYGNNLGNDIKVPWEIGRLQHLPILALDYNRTESQSLFIEIKNQLFDFMASNPPKFGVQWMTSMDIGIRLVNILITLFTINSNKQQFENIEIELIDSYLYDHYLHIKDNIEYSEGMRGNHYLSNLCSILIYTSFTENNEGKLALLTKYRNLLDKELEFQFNGDGTNFEGSTRYHIFTNQMLLTTDLLLVNNGVEGLNKDKLKNISCFTKTLLNFDTPPQIGDNDSGFYWKVLDSEKSTYDSLKKIIENNYKTDNRYIYNDFGYIQSKYDRIDLLFKCGKLGQNGKGGHDHNDNLSYQLYLDKQPIIVDIGSYCYTSDFEYRNLFRSTKSHNVLWVSDTEQNEFSFSNNDDMFWLNTNNSNPVLEILEDNNISGSIDYKGKVYKRTVKYDSKIISVTDNYNSELNKIVNIHLFPSIRIENVENNVYKLWNEKMTLYFESQDANISIEKYEYSPCYGVKQQSNKIVLSSLKNSITHRYRVEFES